MNFVSKIFQAQLWLSIFIFTVRGCTILYADWTEQTFTSHGSYGWGDNYFNDMDECWVIEAPSGYAVQAYCFNLETEAAYDEVTIRCGDSNSDVLIGEYSGSATFNVISSGRNMYIRFQTDVITTALGFQITYIITSSDNDDCTSSSGSGGSNGYSSSYSSSNAWIAAVVVVPIVFIVIIAISIALRVWYRTKYGNRGTVGIGAAGTASAQNGGMSYNGGLPTYHGTTVGTQQSHMSAVFSSNQPMGSTTNYGGFTQGVFNTGSYPPQIPAYPPQDSAYPPPQPYNPY